MKQKEIIVKVVAELSRLMVGGVFAFSGFVKAIDPVGNAIKISDYLVAFGLDAFLPFKTFLAFNQGALEFLLGVTMLLGVYRRYTSFLLLALMVVMTPLTLYLAIFNPVSDCGCFGDALIISNWATFNKNVVLLAASIFAFIHNQKLFQVFSYKVYWFVAVWTYLYCVVFSYWNYNHLPLIDFRPYKIGANISRLMEIPEGAPADEYEYSFIYEKDGVKKEFSLDDYPANDDTWTFVDSKTLLVKEGYHPPINDFYIFDENGDDVGHSLLENKGGLLLLVADKLEEASDKRIDEINDIYDYALDKNLPFYCVTGSSTDDVGSWIERTGAEYPFLYADDVLLKTIIRSNPGLVLLKEGTILMKWHYNDILEEEKLEAVLTGYLEANESNRKSNRWIIFNLLTFGVPLLLVWVYDLFRFRRKKLEIEIQ